MNCQGVCFNEVNFGFVLRNVRKRSLRSTTDINKLYFRPKLDLSQVTSGEAVSGLPISSPFSHSVNAQRAQTKSDTRYNRKGLYILYEK